MITLKHLNKKFGSLKAVDDLSLIINQGEILGFLGPNGAGKTTTIRILCGLLQADSGQIHWAGLTGDHKTQIGLCPQENIYWPRLTCFEQLVFVGQTYGLRRDLLTTRAAELLDTLGLTQKRNVLADRLSGGMKRRLNIALALIHDPPVLILDEPEAGLDPQSRVLVRDLVRSLARKKTVILTTHNMDEAERLADRVAIIDHGRLLTLDTVANLKQLAGEGDCLELEISTLAPEKQTALQTALQQQLGPRLQLQVSGPHFQLRTMDILTRIPQISQILQQHQVAIEKMQLRKNTLEDVFIQLTGRGLRE